MNNAQKDGTRLNKFIASSGLTSRRGADTLIFNGEVTVNKEICLIPGYLVKRDDHVKVNGKSIRAKDTTSIIYYKLPGYVTTKNDELGRETIYDKLPAKYSHLNHVGRLDQDSEGLLVLTNDGELANRLTHPRQKLEKEYMVTADQTFQDEHLAQFLKGIYLEDGRATAKSVTRITGRRITMVLETGMKRQIRLMCRALGYKVKRLIRTRIGSYQGLDLEPGEARELLEGEITALLRNPSGKSAQKSKNTIERKPAAKKTARKSTGRNSSRSSAGSTSRSNNRGSSRSFSGSTSRTSNRSSSRGSDKGRPAKKATNSRTPRRRTGR